MSFSVRIRIPCFMTILILPFKPGQLNIWKILSVLDGIAARRIDHFEEKVCKNYTNFVVKKFRSGSDLAIHFRIHHTVSKYREARWHVDHLIIYLQEEYLLGKKIDKNFESKGTMGQLNAVEYDCAPPSIFASTAQHQVLLAPPFCFLPVFGIRKKIFGRSVDP